MATATSETVKGGAWLVGETDPATVFTPEQLSDEHKLIRQTAQEFMKGEVLPVVERLEKKEWSLNRELLRKCGGLGLLGTNIPEEYGGVDLDKIATMIVSECIAMQASFATTFGAQANLTILPIYMFGTEAQKKKYLPGLVSGEMAGAYGLSESGSGSDALGAKTRAMKQADGSFIMSGEKMWISNGGFADVFIIFAQVIDGDPSTSSGSARAESRADPTRRELRSKRSCLTSGRIAARLPTKSRSIFRRRARRSNSSAAITWRRKCRARRRAPRSRSRRARPAPAQWCRSTCTCRARVHAAAGAAKCGASGASRATARARSYCRSG